MPKNAIQKSHFQEYLQTRLQEYPRFLRVTAVILHHWEINDSVRNSNKLELIKAISSLKAQSHQKRKSFTILHRTTWRTDEIDIPF